MGSTFPGGEWIAAIIFIVMGCLFIGGIAFLATLGLRDLPNGLIMLLPIGFLSFMSYLLIKFGFGFLYFSLKFTQVTVDLENRMLTIMGYNTFNHYASLKNISYVAMSFKESEGLHKISVKLDDLWKIEFKKELVGKNEVHLILLTTRGGQRLIAANSTQYSLHFFFSHTPLRRLYETLRAKLPSHSYLFITSI